MQALFKKLGGGAPAKAAKKAAGVAKKAAVSVMQYWGVRVRMWHLRGLHSQVLYC